MQKRNCLRIRPRLPLMKTGTNRFVIGLVDSLQQAGEMSLRMYAMITKDTSNLEYYLNKGIVKTDRLNIR